MSAIAMDTGLLLTLPSPVAKLHFSPSTLHLHSTHHRLLLSSTATRKQNSYITQSISSNSKSSTPITQFNPSTRLFISGLSFRTTDESLRNAFNNFGELLEVNVVMDKIANRPRGFAFVRYATEEESKRAIEGMHGKFLDGRVIFVEIAKRRG